MTVRLLDVRVWNHAEQPGHSVYVRGPFPRRIWRCARHDCDWSHHETTGVTVGDQEAPTEPPDDDEIDLRCSWCPGDVDDAEHLAIGCPAAPQVAPTEACPCDPNEPCRYPICAGAPQVAPEPAAIASRVDEMLRAWGMTDRTFFGVTAIEMREYVESLRRFDESALERTTTYSILPDRDPAEVAPEPERCPTCGSDNPSIHVTGTPQNPDRERCPDPWHRPAPLVEEEQGDG